jgi:hypothetical protein
MSIAYKEQQVHKALPATSHDELARQHFVRSFKEHLVTHLHPGLKTAYEKRAKGKFLKEHQREPETIQEVGAGHEPGPSLSGMELLTCARVRK